MRYALVSVVAAAVVSSTTGGAQSATDVHRVVYVTATTKDGAYVSDLTADDITVEEDGRQRQILDVARNTDRLKVALAIDELLAPYRDVRQAAWQFVQQVTVYGDVALYLVGRSNERQVDYTSDLAPFWDAINALPVRPRYPGELVDSLHEIAQDQLRLEGRRAIVVLAPELAQLSRMTAEGVLDDLRDTGAVMYSVTVMSTFDAPPTFEENPTTRLEGGDLTQQVERDRIITNGPKQSGGLRLASMDFDAFPSAVDRIAEDLLHEYAVTYRMPAGTKSNGRVKVDAEREGLAIRGPTRLPEL